MYKWTLVALVAFAASFGVAAQGAKYKVGKKATPQQIRAFDISISPDGTGLPAGQGNARIGRNLYLQKCAICHGERGEGRPGFAPLAGGIGTLQSKEPVLTVGSFWPYATTVFDYTNRAMPPQDPGSLTPNETYAITAYILHLNGLVKETDPVNAKTLPKIVMPNRNGFIPDQRPDVKNVKQQLQHM